MTLRLAGNNYNGFVQSGIKGHIKTKKQKSPPSRVTSQELKYLADSYEITHTHVARPELLGLESMKLFRAKNIMWGK